ELGKKLLTHRADATVAQVIYIINFGLPVGQANQVFDYGNNIFLAQHFSVQADVQAEFAVDLIAADFSQVITLIGEEQLLDNPAGGFIVGGIGTPQLTIDMLNGFQFRIGGVLVQGIIDNGII